MSARNTENDRRMKLHNCWNAKVHYRGQYLAMLEHDTKEYFHNIRAQGIVLIIPLTPAHEVIFIEQYRIVLDSKVIEYPAGMAGDEIEFRDESFVTAAERELLEEAGYECDNMRFLFAAPTSPGATTEIVNFYLALDCRKTAEGGGDASEDIAVHKIPLTGAHNWLEKKAASGILIDPRIYTGLYFIQQTIGKKPDANI